MEPSIIAAVVSAAGSVAAGALAKVIELFAGKREGKGQEEASRVVEKVYETLKGNLTDGCVRILKLLESGTLLYPVMIRKRFYPTIALPTLGRTR
jgi:hypothetical protein